MREQIHEIEQERLRQLSVLPDKEKGPLAIVRLLSRIIGVGIETADMLVNEILSRGLRDRRAVARYAGLTGAPDESGQRRREKGLARAGNARVRYDMMLWLGGSSNSKRTARWRPGFARERPMAVAVRARQ
ncbi:hypothetical protein X726_32695 [Mesorhizobium sp. L103C105A0]|nr:hypothetical protein X726_32695 [Mesorhizobium sp. L103C105A0]